MPSLEERLGRVGDTLWLTAVAGGVALVCVLVVLFALGVLGGLGPLAGAAGALLVCLGVLYALFGDWDWEAGGEARQHAVFFVSYVGLTALGLWGLRTALGEPGPDEGVLVFPLALLTLAVAGWLAYLGGLRRLAALAG